MSNQAETTECVDCSGRGFRGVLGGLCPTCSGTGVRTTGAVNATGHDGCIRGLDKAKATIAAQAAEIERLKGELHEAYTDDATGDVFKDRDVLRLEVQKLKDERHEAADLYAAIEAERDALRAKLDAELSHPLRAIAEKQREDFDRLLSEANARAESYLRVIEAKDAEIAAMAEGWKASLRAGVAMSEAGLGFRHVSHGLNSPVARKEADRG